MMCNSRKNRTKIVLFFRLFCAFLIFGVCENLSATEIPPLTGAIVDAAKLLSAQEKTQIENFLRDFDQKTDAQIAVLTVKSLSDSFQNDFFQSEDIDSFALRVAEKWKIGQKGIDSGVLIVIAHNEREIAIKTGYGVEGNLTDAKCGLIIRNVIAPAFQNGEYGKGILDGCKTIAGIVLNDETLISENALSDASKNDAQESGGAALAFFVCFIVFMLFSSRSRIGWLPFLFFPRFGGAGRGGSSGYTSSPRFSGGGGRFGGGGASGKW
ncbi:MAG: hypothetical protein Ta2A_22920 [Treponemataceae bacterium]|nr:MAG: hypothetical protein Ta2A_22920 [Treponemataceae bacterium]